jgi:hypothetical protein
LGLQENIQQQVETTTPSILDDVIKETEEYCGEHTSDDSDLFKGGGKVLAGARDAARMILKCTLQVKSLGDAAAKFDKSGHGKKLLFS